MSRGRRAFEAIEAVHTAHWLWGLLVGAIPVAGGWFAGAPLGLFFLLVVPLGVVAFLGTVMGLVLCQHHIKRPVRVVPPDAPVGGTVQVIVRMKLGSPSQQARESEIAWWHIDVSNTDPTHAPVGPCKVFLRLQQPGGMRELQLLWPTLEGPKEEAILRAGEPPRLVPVVARADVDGTLSGDPVRLPHFPLPAGIARITDVNAIIHRRDFTDLPPGLHRFQICVREGPTEHASEPYHVNVPSPRAGHARFRLIQEPPGGTPLTQTWVEQWLLDLGFPEDREHLPALVETLKHNGIADQASALRFFADGTVRQMLADDYREEFGPKRVLDPTGFCQWGPRLHLCAIDTRPLVRATLKDWLRTLHQQGWN